MLNAACRCGQVRMTALSDPIATVRCYCKSCLKGSTALAKLPGAVSVLESDGGTDYTLFRKDHVRCTAGQGLLAEHRLRPDSPTRRVIATCCNSPVFLDFTRGHWVNLYRRGIDPAVRPTASMGVMARNRPATPGSESTMVPTYSAFPLGFFARLMFSWAAMGFRRPAIDYVEKRFEV